MQTNQGITEEIAPENCTEMKNIHDKYRKRQGQTTFKMGGGQNKTAISNGNFKSFDNTKQAAGVYKPKVQVPRQSMESHMSSKFSTVSTSRENINP